MAPSRTTPEDEVRTEHYGRSVGLATPGQHHTRDVSSNCLIHRSRDSIELRIDGVNIPLSASQADALADVLANPHRAGRLATLFAVFAERPAQK
jgi:hypothetical protein